jgi:hypothetical protein
VEVKVGNKQWMRPEEKKEKNVKGEYKKLYELFDDMRIPVSTGVGANGIRSLSVGRTNFLFDKASGRFLRCVWLRYEMRHKWQALDRTPKNREACVRELQGSYGFWEVPGKGVEAEEEYKAVLP